MLIRQQANKTFTQQKLLYEYTVSLQMQQTAIYRKFIKSAKIIRKLQRETQTICAKSKKVKQPTLTTPPKTIITATRVAQ